ncbi:hypothetical protein [Paraburkholderia youngii]|uniref:hypothetical protein n=1 Tax=Paraburkholderia youngii TaxID=2782701 RepID=UPI003D218685
MVKKVEPVDTELHPQPRVWTLTYRQNELLSKYPLFFRAVHYPWSYSANISHFGILCGGGWYPIIEALARDVEFELHALWRDQFRSPDQIADLEGALVAGRVNFPVLPICTDISQVGGQLKVEFLHGNMCPADVAERIRSHIDIAEASSRYICESCGRSGKFRQSYWRRVYCDDCITPVAHLRQALTPA